MFCLIKNAADDATANTGKQSHINYLKMFLIMFTLCDTVLTWTYDCWIKVFFQEWYAEVNAIKQNNIDCLYLQTFLFNHNNSSQSKTIMLYWLQ